MAVVSTGRVKRQKPDGDSDYHYGPNHNAPHLILFNGDWDVDWDGIDIEKPDLIPDFGDLVNLLPFPIGKKK